MTSLEEKTAAVEISPGPLQGINSTDWNAGASPTDTQLWACFSAWNASDS